MIHLSVQEHTQQHVPTIPTFKYFGGLRGRGMRITLLLATQPTFHYHNVGVTFPEWGAMKSTTPFGGLPVWIDDQVGEIGESHTIARYLGEKFHLMGDNAREKWTIDSFTGFAEDTMRYIFKIFSEPDEGKRNESITGIQSYIDRAEAAAVRNGSNGYFVGNKTSVADVEMFDIFVNLVAVFGYDRIKAKPALWRCLTNFAKHPGVKAYINSTHYPPQTAPSFPNLHYGNDAQRCLVDHDLLNA